MSPRVSFDSLRRSLRAAFVTAAVDPYAVVEGLGRRQERVNKRLPTSLAFFVLNVCN
jgi:hypothetical protein